MEQWPTPKPPINDPELAARIIEENKRKLMEGNSVNKQVGGSTHEFARKEVTRNDPELAKKIIEENRRKLFGGDKERKAA